MDIDLSNQQAQSVTYALPIRFQAIFFVPYQNIYFRVLKSTIFRIRRMNVVNRIVFKNVFKTICIISASLMIGYWLYKFKIEDRDVGVVDYVVMDGSLGIPLPIASVCITDPFLEAKMLELNPPIHFNRYIMFMMGWEFDENMLESLTNVDYSNLTLKLRDYVISTTSYTRDGPYGVEDSLYHTDSYNGFADNGEFEKCFEIKSIEPDYLLRETRVNYNLSSIWNDLGGKKKISVNIHYPGQQLLRTNLPIEFKSGGLTQSMVLSINDIEVIKSRNSRNRRCTPYDKMRKFDDMVREKHIQASKCRAPYLRPFQDFLTCNTRESLKTSIYKYRNVRSKYYPASCQRLSKISYEKTDKYDDKESNWALAILYPDYIRIITQSKEVDIHALVGNIGGYIGLFLGNNFISSYVVITIV